MKQYCILTRCLHDLRKSDLPLIEKLRLEVQLIQTKRILLDHNVECRVTGLASSEKEFDDLYEQLQHVCNSGGITGDLERLKMVIQGIRDGLNFETNDKISYTPLMINDRKSQGAVRRPLYGVKDFFR